MTGTDARAGAAGLYLGGCLWLFGIDLRDSLLFAFVLFVMLRTAR